MIIAKRLRGKAIAAWLGSTGDAARRALHRVRGASRTLDFYFDIGDPWSYLAGQAVERLVKAYPVELVMHVVSPPASDVDPAPELRARHSVRDAQQLAEFWNLDFPGKREPDPTMLRDAGTALIRERPAAEQLRAALDLTGALWAGDRKRLASLLGSLGADSSMALPPFLAGKYAELRKAGHYQGAMIGYGGNWYWGIDRLHYLEAELARDLEREHVSVVAPRPLAERGPKPLSDKPLTCEMWFSFRSPYSYLALEQIEVVLAAYQVPLVLRPVLPMLTRGLTMPQIKRMYIARDAKREADRLGIAFGELCEPTGSGVDHCLALAHWAAARGGGADIAFARSVTRGIWAEARDPGEYVDLRELVERAGLPWDEARAALGNPAGQAAAQANAADLAVIGLWGVPSFRLGDFVAWGNDRLPLLADRLRRHAQSVISPANADRE